MSLNVVQLPVSPLNDVPAMARIFADDVEGGAYGKVKTAIVVLESDEGLVSFGWGAADDPLKVIGLLEAAKATQVEAVLS